MNENEERILRQNADEVNKHVDNLPEMKIYNAMRGGIMRGKKREKKHIYSYGIGAIVTVAAAVLITFSFYNEFPMMAQGQAVDQSSVTENWNDSDLFRSFSLMDDPSFESILDRNLIKPVYQSVEKGSFKVGVMGAVTDGRKVFILYSVQNKMDKPAHVADATLDFGSIKAPSIGTNLTNSVNQISPNATNYFVYSAKLLPSVSYSKDVKFNVALAEKSETNNKNHTNLDTSFEIDPDMFKDQQHKLSAEHTLTVDEQEIKVTQVLYTPLGTYVDVEYEKDNEKQIFQLINPVLIATKGGKTDKLYYPHITTTYNSEIYSDDSKATLVFKSTEYSDPDSITLKTFGISAVDKDQMKIVVDINKKQMISAPGNDLELIEPSPENNAEEGEILLRQKIVIDNQNSQFLNSYPWLSATFTDAIGQVHNNVTVNKTSTWGNFSTRSKVGTVVNEISYRFGENAKDYPQPLTIPVKRYANPIMDTQAVELYTKN